MERHVIVDNGLAIMAQRFRLGAPDMKTGPFIDAPRDGRRRRDAEVHPCHASQRMGMTQRRIKKLGRDTLTAITWDYIHPPQVALMRKLEMTISIQSHGADEIVEKTRR